jgi:hypothetical protein
MKGSDRPMIYEILNHIRYLQIEKFKKAVKEKSEKSKN